jgi:hypothetical protein
VGEMRISRRESRTEVCVVHIQGGCWRGIVNKNKNTKMCAHPFGVAVSTAPFIPSWI